MIRTQIQLDAPTYDKLKQAALQQRRSMAACIREAIAGYLGRTEVDADELAAIAGKFQPLSMDDLKGHDRHWANAVTGERPPP